MATHTHTLTRNVVHHGSASGPIIGDATANGSIRGQVMDDGSLRPHWAASMVWADGMHSFIGYRSTREDAVRAIVDSCDYCYRESIPAR